jgi:hypothetical protein
MNAKDLGFQHEGLQLAVSSALMPRELYVLEKHCSNPSHEFHPEAKYLSHEETMISDSGKTL